MLEGVKVSIQNEQAQRKLCAINSDREKADILHKEALTRFIEANNAYLKAKDKELSSKFELRLIIVVLTSFALLFGAGAYLCQAERVECINYSVPTKTLLF